MQSSNSTLDPILEEKSKPANRQGILYRVLYILVLVVDVIGLCLTAGSIMWLIFGEGTLPSWHFSSLMPGIIAVSPIFAILGLLRRRRWLFFHALPALLFIGMYGVFFIPRSPHVPADTPQLRVMTFNTQFRVNEAPIIQQIILDADADIVALQELSEPAADYFEDHLAEEYPYQITRTNGTSTSGKGLFSRYPLFDERIDTLDGWLYYVRAKINFNGETVTVVNTHPSPPRYGIGYSYATRSHHIDWIMDQLATESGALIVMGDFNTTEHSDDYRQITAIYRDSVREVGLGLGQSFPDSSRWRAFKFIPPLIRIDYIFHSEHLQAISAGTLADSAGSDHRPVVANLMLNPNS